jgi:hypothetical protein
MRVELRCRCGAELVLDDVQSHTLVGLPVLETFLSQHEKCPYKGEQRNCLADVIQYTPKETTGV